MTVEINATKFGDSVKAVRYSSIVELSFGNELYLNVSVESVKNLIKEMSDVVNGDE